MAIRDAAAPASMSVAQLASAAVDSMPLAVACVDGDMRVVLANRAFTDALRVAAGGALESARPPLPRVAACAREVIASGSAADLDLGAALGRAHITPLDAGHATVVLIPVAADHARSLQEQAAIRRVAILVAKEAGDDVLFAAAAEQAARLAGVDAGGVLRYMGDARAVVVGVWRDGGTRGFPVNAEIDFDRTNSALGRARATRRPARADTYEGRRGELPVVMRAVGLRSSVVAPIIVEGEVWGGLVVSTTREEPLPDDTEELLVPFAELVAQGLANREARRRLAASRLRIVEAADEKRRRLEGHLHEGAHQHLLALLLKLRVAQARAQAGSEPASLIEDAAAEARQVQAALHELARGLHPAVLTERGLAAALQSLAARAALPVGLRLLPRGRFATSIETTAYFIVEEALANAQRHAGAMDVTVSVEDRGDRLAIEVVDNGAGGADPQDGSGLHALADRVAAVGGYLDVESPPGGGTIVRAQLPVGR